MFWQTVSSEKPPETQKGRLTTDSQSPDGLFAVLYFTIYISRTGKRVTGAFLVYQQVKAWQKTWSVWIPAPSESPLPGLLAYGVIPSGS